MPELATVPVEPPAREPLKLVAAPSDEAWSTPTRWAFRFSFLFFLINYAPFPLTSIPKMDALFQWYGDLWDWAVDWVGRTFLGIDGLLLSQQNGSGDRTADYVAMLIVVVLSLLGTAAWSLLDRRRAYPRLHALTHMYVRYALASTMLFYGLSKVIKVQMPSSMGRMLETYGQSSPAGLLWTFMGESTTYTVFAGACEVLGGLLLLTRRTATLGALVCAGVMTNVVMLNFSYDVAVKLFSTQLLLTALFLAAPAARRLLDVFILNRPTQPVELGARIPWRPLRIARWIVKPALIGWLLYTDISINLENYQQWEGAPIPPVYGMYEVVDFVRDGRTVPANLDEGSRWKRVAFDRGGTGGVVRMDDGYSFFMGKQDERAATIQLGMRARIPAYLGFEKLDGGEVLLHGEVDGSLVMMRLRPSDPARLLLKNRGFHWVNEMPFNR